MDYKIGEKFHVIIPGFSPTVARIDNISDRNGDKFYHISFQEEHLYTICRVVSERALTEMIEMYDTNKNNLEDFMMSKNENGVGEHPSKSSTSEKEESNEDTPTSGSDSGGAVVGLESTSGNKINVMGEDTSTVKAGVNIGIMSQKK